MRTDETLERHNVPYRHTAGLTESIWMGRPRLYATTVARKAAWRRRQGMAVRPHYPSAAAKQAASRARKRQTARDPAEPRVCGDPAGAPDAGAVRSVLGDVWPDRRQWPGQRTCHARRRRTGTPRAPQARSLSSMEPLRRACAGIGGRSSAGHTAGPPGQSRRTGRTTWGPGAPVRTARGRARQAGSSYRE